MIKVINPDIILSFKSKITEIKDEKLFQQINSLFMNSKYKKLKKKKKSVKRNWKKKVNFEKKINNLITHVNDILNKLTRNNFDLILEEFVSNPIFFLPKNIKNISTNFWKKMIHDENFINLYLDFLFTIQSIVEKSKLNLDFIENILILTELKYKSDFLNINNEIQELIQVPEDITEENLNDYLSVYKINNLKIIHYLIENKILSEVFEDNIIDILNENDKNGELFYKWFSFYKVLSKKNTEKLSLILEENNFSNRIKILLENLLEKENNSNINFITEEEDDFDNEIINIIEEYLYIKDIEEIKHYLNIFCKDSINKNKFCSHLYYVWLTHSKEEGQLIYKLINQILFKNILFKSNFSRGLSITYEKWNNINIDYPNATNHINIILKQLKKHNITKKIEYIFINHNQIIEV